NSTGSPNMHAPAFSPDGSRLVVVKGTDIYAIEIASKALTRLTNSSVNADPAFSPDGKRIFFVSTRDSSQGEIYSMNASDGSAVTRLTNNEFVDVQPAPSPDGRLVVCTSNRDGAFALYSMNAANGSDVTRLTTSNDGPAFATWSPSGDVLY